MNDHAHAAPSVRILIVVASAPLRSAIRQTLQMLQPGCECIEAASGAEALGIARARALDLLLLDLALPVLDAPALLGELIRLDPHARIHVLADPHQLDAARQRLGSAAGTLSKDNLFEELGQLLRTRCSGRA
jgi:DNA-binding NarL/FixJ family response regulator